MAKIDDRAFGYINDKEFLKDYVEILNSRLIYTNNKLEEDQDVEMLYDYANILTLRDNYKAIEILYNELQNRNRITEELIIKIADTINKHSMYISNGYRKVDNKVSFNNEFPIDKPENIKENLNNLIDKYYNEWKDMDIFEREARFNVEFIRIHPFEDGNGRASRLLLNYNLARQLHAPVLIPEGIREDYFYAIRHNDIEWIKRLFEVLSNKELKALNNLIDYYEKDKEIEREKSL